MLVEKTHYLNIYFDFADCEPWDDDTGSKAAVRPKNKRRKAGFTIQSFQMRTRNPVAEQSGNRRGSRNESQGRSCHRGRRISMLLNGENQGMSFLGGGVLESKPNLKTVR